MAVAITTTALIPFVRGGDLQILSYRTLDLKGVDRLVIGAARLLNRYDRLIKEAVTGAIGCTVDKLDQGYARACRSSRLRRCWGGCA